MNGFVKRIFSYDIVRHSSLLLSGSFIGQAIAFAVYPLLTRIYSESDFGAFATYSSFCSLLAIIGTLRYEESLVIAKNEGETNSLFSFSFRFLLCFSFALFVCFFFFGKSVLSFFRFDSISDFCLYIPLSVFLAGSIALLTNIAIREKQFKKIAYAGVVQNTSNAVSRVALGKASLTKIGLILSNVVALLASASVLFGIRKKLSNKTTLGEEINTALKYKDFPIYNGTRSALSQVSSNLPFLFLPGFFESDQIGIFSLAFIMLTTPVNLIIGSLFTSFFEKLSSSQKLNEPLMPLVKQYWKSLCIYILPLFVIAILLAKPLFPFVFGNRWEVAGTYFSYLAPWGFMMLLINPFYSIFIIFRKQKAFLLIDILYLTVRVIALYIGVLSADFKLCVICFSLSGILFTIIYFSRIYHILQQYEKKLI